MEGGDKIAEKDKLPQEQQPQPEVELLESSSVSSQQHSETPSTEEKQLESEDKIHPVPVPEEKTSGEESVSEVEIQAQEESTGSTVCETEPELVAEADAIILEEMEQDTIVEMEQEQDSIIEMEVDDSNTGDTITSNPEIDLGSAAAAATAVYIEQDPVDYDDEDSSSVPIIVNVSTASGKLLPASAVLMEERPEVTDTPASPTMDFESDEVRLDTSTPASPLPPSAQSPSPETYDYKSSKDYSPDEPPSTEPTDTPAEPDAEDFQACTETEPLAYVDSSPPGEYSDPQRQDFDSALDTEPEQDQGYLHEEESMASCPDADLDKENNLDLGDGDDDNEDGILEIMRRRISQEREGNCYCGKDRNFNIAELLCASCYRWFHESCISYQPGKLVPFITNYVFTCKNCHPTGLENFKRNAAQLSQMCVTALANLTQSSIKDGTNIKRFSKDREILPFFEMHWEALNPPKKQMTQTWSSTVTKNLIKEAGLLYTMYEVEGDENSPYFSLNSEDLTQIRPNYEAMISSGQLKITDPRNMASLRGRRQRRAVLDPTQPVQTIIKKPRGEGMFGPKPVGHGYPTEHPFNKDSYRYILAEPDPNAPFRQEFDESNEFSGKPIHGWLCRVVNPSSVLLALHDRAPQLKISDDRLSVTGEKGYCMIRATHGVTRGSWYFEAKITDMPEGSATRIGFSQKFGNLQGPLGFDRYGYSWRSRYGTVFHEARGKSYAKGGYGLNDVLGFLIILPEEKHVPLVPTSFKDRPLVKVKSHLYYEDKDDPSDYDKRDLRKHSKIVCFKNGVCQGIAYEDIYCGTYYPAISLYRSITVRVNFGPDFEAPPQNPNIEYRGFHERAECSTIEQTMADMLYLTENEGRLHLDNAVPMPL